MTVVGGPVYTGSMQTKTCSRCGATKAIDRFNKQARGKYGVTSICKDCKNAQRTQDRRDRGVGPRINWTEEGQTCKDCKEFRSWASFGKHSRSSSGFNYRCKSCVRVRSAQYRSVPENRALRASSTAAWKKENLDRLVQYEAKRRSRTSCTVTNRDLTRLLARQDNRCAICSSILTEKHLDHIIPISRGGVHGIGNLQYLCPTHNMQKGTKTMTEMKKWKGVIG